MNERYEAPPVVMDTNVLVAGACRRESSLAYQILKKVLSKQIPLMLTETIALEYLEVLQRKPVMELTRLGYEQSADLVNELIELSRQIQLSFSWRPNLRDESDNKFVEAAVFGRAMILTCNIRDFQSPDLTRFGWQAMTPHEFMTRYFSIGGMENG
ncbi:MAG TPA: putative toxin-antitoxin system toxin component, PIN family [Acidobacteriota bacterium]|nr:putative toxin-antitoxin system toxin component, PIN family [Acidobacteriota bacterium]